MNWLLPLIWNINPLVNQHSDLPAQLMCFAPLLTQHNGPFFKICKLLSLLPSLVYFHAYLALATIMHQNESNKVHCLGTSYVVILVSLLIRQTPKIQDLAQGYELLTPLMCLQINEYTYYSFTYYTKRRIESFLWKFSWLCKETFMSVSQLTTYNWRKPDGICITVDNQ